ncbi:MAG: Glu/Leu/Phe/Val dehydrogenase dimerization domain-containing protein [Myxococcota bacterium]
MAEFRRLFADAERTFVFQHSSGLRAFLVVDSTRLGPAAGGIRTATYADEADALADARRLAAAMTLKCALAGLDAGGAKTVVIADALVDRAAAFASLGAFVQELGGLYRCAGDYGTTDADLSAVASTCEYVHQGAVLAESVAQGALACLRAASRFVGREVEGLRVAVQGCGAIGTAYARALVAAGCDVRVCDIDRGRAEALAQTHPSMIAIEPEDFLTSEVDVLAPCARGGVLDDAAARRVRASIVCGAANNVCAGGGAGVLHARGIVHVPDVLASAGAVVDGIGRTVMGLADRTPLIEGLGDTASQLLERARSAAMPTEAMAAQMAAQRLNH